MYRDTATERAGIGVGRGALGAGRHGQARTQQGTWRCDKARGARGQTRGARADERGARAEERGVRGPQGARHGRWARGLGVLLGCGLCTWCTQPFLTRFDSVLFLSRFLDTVREPGS